MFNWLYNFRIFSSRCCLGAVGGALLAFTPFLREKLFSINLRGDHAEAARNAFGVVISFTGTNRSRGLGGLMDWGRVLPFLLSSLTRTKPTVRILFPFSGLKVFRHPCATSMLEGGADIRFIQQLLGHGEFSTILDLHHVHHVSFQQFKQVHSATHPARLEPKRAARAETDSTKLPGRAREA